MANLSGVARPYAVAAFEHARDSKQLAAWKDFLEAASFYASQPAVQKVMANPELSSKELFDFFIGFMSNVVHKDQHNFLLLIAQNKRFNALPEIAHLFNAYVAALEKVSNVRVTTAIEAEESFRNKLAAALTKRIQREVKLQCEVDPTIIGGAIIQIGDRVIDGSIRGKLSRLYESLTG
jgi:F-type H+-transporting ATPase subunit delta